MQPDKADFRDNLIQGVNELARRTRRSAGVEGGWTRGSEDQQETRVGFKDYLAGMWLPC